MVRVSTDRVRLSLSDWVGVGSLALSVLMLVGATLYKVHDTSAADRARQVRIDTELGYLKTQVGRLQEDVRALVLCSRQQAASNP